MLLRELDTQGRVPGAIVGTVDEALDYLKELRARTKGNDVFLPSLLRGRGAGGEGAACARTQGKRRSH